MDVITLKSATPLESDQTACTAEVRLLTADPIHGMEGFDYVEVQFPSSLNIREYAVFNAFAHIFPSFKTAWMDFRIDDTRVIRYIKQS
jgi:hypothetical protein